MQHAARPPRVPPPGTASAYNCCHHCRHIELLRHTVPCPNGCNGPRTLSSKHPN
jgi:hypothetical protein